MSPAFRKALVNWYRHNARDLPWRRKPTPYHVWVSEIMLQQTRVEAARDHYTRFVRRFPTIRRLAEADEEDVLHAWSGLGYYRRARRLHAAAGKIVQQGGRFPTDRADVLALPGVGLYTAGAILSIAFNRPEPIVDGNVERVFARMHALTENAKSKEGRTIIWQAATRHVKHGTDDGHAPRDLNQALMELGATICKPTPDCRACPVRRWCKARAQGEPARFPVLPPRAKAKARRYLFAGLFDDQNRVLLVRREQSDRTSLLPAGLWELPHAEWRTSKPATLQAIEARYELCLGARGDPATHKHAIMDYRLTLAMQPCAGHGTEGPSRRWFTPSQARKVPIASATRKLLDTWGGAGW